MLQSNVNAALDAPSAPSIWMEIPLPPDSLKHSGRVVLGNAGLNLLGNLVPIAIAALAIPYLIHAIGTERFGFFSLAWVLLGYFSVFDLGLGRALTKFIAEREGDGKPDELADLVITALWLVGGVSVVAAVAMGVLWPWRDVIAFARTASGHTEVSWALAWVMLGVPFTVMATALRGILEGHQDFRRVGMLRALGGVLLMGGPCLLATWRPDLPSAVGGLAAARITLFALHVYQVRVYAHGPRGRFNTQWVRPLLRFGGWLTVSNIVGPVIVYVDRFVVAGAISASALTYYVTPFEIVSRMLVVPQALTGALFPALSGLQVNDPERSARLLLKGLGVCALIVIPMSLIGAMLSGWILRLWLGPDFEAHSRLVMQILLLGFAFNALAHLPFTGLQSLGATKISALLHLIELPVYIMVLVVMVHRWQLVGAAWAWTLRGATDCVCLGLLYQRELNRAKVAATALVTT